MPTEARPRRRPPPPRATCRDRDRRQRCAQRQQPGARLAPRQRIQRPSGAEVLPRPAELRSIPLDGLRRGALGRLGGEEVLDWGAPPVGV